MNKLRAIFCCTIMALSCTMNAKADDRYAHEYYSDSDDERRDRDRRRDNHEREEWYESERREKRAMQMPRYQQSYQQSPIQIYMQPPQQHFQQHDKQFREDRRWREELERLPQTPYLENQFDRDDTHW
ncbi:MAG: hypothetical protein WCJ11_04875 [Methylococcaceae bacterium]